jgi:hypothetical protein
MNSVKTHIAKNIQELPELTSSMLLSAPTFIDRTGYFPYRNLDYVFRELHEGLNHNRRILGEERYAELARMSERMWALFEADPEDKTGGTLQGSKIINEMEDVLEQVRRKF